MRWFFVLLAACRYEPSAVDVDGPLPAGPCQELGATCAGNQLRTCTVLGELPEERTCGWGCEDGAARCLGITPAGGAVAATDLDPTTFGALTDVTLGATTIDSDTGTIVPAPIGFDHRTADTVEIFRFGSLHLTGPIKLIGSRSIALVADGAITIDGRVDARGCTGLLGLRRAGPGGHDGGDADEAGAGDGGGSTAGDTFGAGGGGHAGTGGTGGGAGNAGGAGGTPFGDDAITSLTGGGGGGGGPGGGGGIGGGGGGALQIVSNTSITMIAEGGINASGCGGGLGAGGGKDGGGGGGAGGTILLEAPAIAIAGALAVNGGGGGGSGDGSDGTTGTLDRSRAPGGTAGGGGGGGAIGGDGAAGDTRDGGPGVTAPRSSGGAGAIGRIRITTLTGSAELIGATSSPAVTDLPLTSCTQGTPTLD